MKIKQNLFLLLIAMLLTIVISRDTFALFNDFEDSNNSAIAAWTSQKWIQTSQSDFNAGLVGATYNTDASTYPDDVILNLVPNVTLITADDTTISTSTGGYSLMKTLNFTKVDTTYNTIRIDSNLKVDNVAYTVYSSIRVNGTESFTHTCTTTSYTNYTDTLDIAADAIGTSYAVTLYMRVSNPGESGKNSKFELYRVTPTFIVGNSTTQTTNTTSYVLKKTLTFTKSGSSYNSLQITSNLKSSSSTRTAYLQIKVDSETTAKFTHSTKSTSYVTYNDTLDFSSYADGTHYINLYMKMSSTAGTATNTVLDLYRMLDSIISNNEEVTVTGESGYELLKVVNFTKNGRTYDELRIDTNLKASSPATAYLWVTLDDTGLWAQDDPSHTTTSSTYYVNYTDYFNFSSLADGPHTVKLYLKTTNKNNLAYNSKLRIYRTKTYALSGTVASQVWDTSTINSRWDGLGWAETLAANSDITFEVRASDTPFAKDDGTLSWNAVIGDSIIQDNLPWGQYKQWRATLTSTDPNRETTPVLSAVDLYYLYRPS